VIKSYFILCIFLFTTVSSLGIAGEIYRSLNPPPIAIIQKYISEWSNYKAKVVGLHQLRDGAYLIITDNSQFCPYDLLRLQTNEWVIGKSNNQFIMIKLNE
jgi:hypothetical protein